MYPRFPPDSGNRAIRGRGKGRSSMSRAWYDGGRGFPHGKPSPLRAADVGPDSVLWQGRRKDDAWIWGEMPGGVRGECGLSSEFWWVVPQGGFRTSRVSDVG